MAEICAICLGDLLVEGEGRQWLQCQHCFHESCITQLKRCSSYTFELCPVCRAKDPELRTVMSMELEALFLYIRITSKTAPQGSADDAGANCRRLFQQILDVDPRHPIAAKHLGFLYSEGIGGEKREDEARSMYEVAIEGGELEAAANLGHLWVKGLGGGKDEKKAREYFAMANEVGNVFGSINLARSLAQGLGGPKDERYARQLLNQAVLAGHAQAIYPLGRMWADGHGGVKDVTKAMDLFTEGDHKGLLECTVQLGIMYIRTSPKKAISFFTKAHMGGNCMGTLKLGAMLALHGGPEEKENARKLLATAMASTETETQATLNLGMMLMEGLGGPTDDVEARRLLEKAHTAGEAEASARLGRMLFEGRGGSKDERRGCKLLEQVAHDNPYAAFSLGTMYFNGSAGSPQDHKKARKHFLSAHGAGMSLATCELAIMMEYGLGGPRDAQEARALYEQADDAGEVRATVNLGSMCLAGDGGPQDDERARALFARADAAGDLQGAVNLGIVYEEGRGGTRDGKEARMLYMKAAKGGNLNGVYNLGLAWETGVGGPVNKTKARNLYSKAADLGHPEASHCLARMNKLGEGGQKDIRAAEKLQAVAKRIREEQVQKYGRPVNFADSSSEAVKNFLSKEVAKAKADLTRCHVCGEPTTKQCAKCKMTMYCSRECQIRDFPKHQKSCCLSKAGVQGRVSESGLHLGSQVDIAAAAAAIAAASTAKAAHPTPFEVAREADLAMQQAVEKSLFSASTETPSINAQVSDALLRSSLKSPSGATEASSSSLFEGIIILELSRHPKALRDALMSNQTLQPCCMALKAAGHSFELPESKAKVFVEPDNFEIAVQAAIEELQPTGGLKPRHVIVSPDLEATVKEIVNQLPCKEHVKVKASKRAAFGLWCQRRASSGASQANQKADDTTDVPYVVSRTFISAGKISSLLSGSSAEGNKTAATW